MAVAHEPPVEVEKEAAAASHMSFFLELVAVVVAETLVLTEADHALESHAMVPASSLYLMVVLPRTAAEILVEKLTKPLVDTKETVMTVMVTIQTMMKMSYTRQSRS